MEKVILVENSGNKADMERYMKNKFTFKGVRAPERRLAAKLMLQDSKNWSNQVILAEIERYYRLEEREYQYIAADLLARNVKRLNYSEISRLFPLINEKAWWDSVDSLRSAIGKWCQLNPAYFLDIFTYFTSSDSFWDRRVALNLQLGFKEKTNLELLSQAIQQDSQTAEFFIQKAIGWALREYSKTDAKWVAEYLKQHPELSQLAIREGSKLL